jgi:hypothetical protein
MLDVYYIPIEKIKKINWTGDAAEYDINLYNLGQGHDEFIIVNPDFPIADFKFNDTMSLPFRHSNRCIVWKYQEMWIAKYFNKHWINEKKYWELDLDLDLDWIRNPDIDSNIIFDTPTIQDLFDLNYQMIWHLNEQFNPTQDKIWVMKCSLKGYTPSGTKDMGYVSPKITYNPDLPNLEYTIGEHIPYYDLVYEHVWLIDDIVSGASNVWAAKITPTNSLGTKIAGTIKIDLPRELDVVFISYDEPNAEENWRRVLEKSPRAFRINGIKGIANAHKCAAELVTSDMFYVVDGDSYLSDEWTFDFQPGIFDRDCVHVWRSVNPINGLTYGYGGVKLLPRQLTLDVDLNNTDMTTSISSKFKLMSKISNFTNFNTSEFNTFRSAFRECAKLSGKTMKRQLSRESETRLNVWCTIGADKPFGVWAIKGANAGRDFGKANLDNQTNLALINDYEWLKIEFSKLSVLNNILLGEI